MNRTRAATLGLLAPAMMALGMSADTSFRFLGDRLGVTGTWERGLLCGVAEAAILALTVYAWATRTKGPAYLAYCAVLVQAVPAFEVSGGFGGTVRVALGPVLLTVLLHLLLGLEVRMSGIRSDSLLRKALREVRERLTASLGIGSRGADSAAIARSRAADRAVDLADRVADVKPGTRRHRRRAAKLAAAIDAARHGLDSEAADAAESAIVGRVVRRKSVAGLATIEARHDWTATLPRPRRDTDRDAATPAPEADRDTATSPVAADRDTADRDTATEQGTATAPAASVAPASVVDLMTKRQTATARVMPAEQERTPAPVAADTAATTPAPLPVDAAPAATPEALTASAADTATVGRTPTATDDATPSVAQMVREAMSAGVTDRDKILSRVRKVRSDVSRATVARAMQRQQNKTSTTGTGAYL